MEWRKHYNLAGQHALMSPSQSAWLNDDEEKFIERVNRAEAARKGTEIHAIAASLIKNDIALPQTTQTLNMYVNDGIGFRMRPEQALYYSPNCFGTADTISFNESQQLLRIHDLKTGATPVKMTQLEIYAALFCLEYGYKPGFISIELRIYQNDDIQIANPTAADIAPIIDEIVSKDRLITQYFGGNLWN